MSGEAGRVDGLAGDKRGRFAITVKHRGCRIGSRWAPVQIAVFLAESRRRQLQAAEVFVVEENVVEDGAGMTRPSAAEGVEIDPAISRKFAASLGGIKSFHQIFLLRLDSPPGKLTCRWLDCAIIGWTRSRKGDTMTFGDWLIKISRLAMRNTAETKRSGVRRQPGKRRLRLEKLDDRRLLAVLAYDLFQSTLHDQPLSSYVSGYDDPGGNVTFQATTCPAHGSLTFAADGSFGFTPNAGYVGLASFTFVATSGPDADTATATIEV
jgi:hypothetical protein